MGGGYYFERTIRQPEFFNFLSNQFVFTARLSRFLVKKDLIVLNFIIFHSAIIDNFIILFVRIQQEMLFFVNIFLMSLLLLRLSSLQHFQSCLASMTGFKDRDFVVLTSANRKAYATHPERFLDDFCADGSPRFDDSFADQIEWRCSHVAAFRVCFLPTFHPIIAHGRLFGEGFYFGFYGM